MARSHCCATRGDCIRTRPTARATISGTELSFVPPATTPSAIEARRMAIAMTLTRKDPEVSSELQPKTRFMVCASLISQPRGPAPAAFRRSLRSRAAQRRQPGFSTVLSALLTAAGPHPRGLSAARFARGLLSGDSPVSARFCLLVPRSLFPSFFQRFEQIVDRQSRGVGFGQHTRDERAKAAFVFAGRVGLSRCGADERPDAAPGLQNAGPLEFGVHAGNGVGVDTKLHGQLPHGRKLIARLQSVGGDRRAQSALELRVDWRRVVRVDGDDAHLSYYTSSLVQIRSREAPQPGNDSLLRALRRDLLQMRVEFVDGGNHCRGRPCQECAPDRRRIIGGLVVLVEVLDAEVDPRNASFVKHVVVGVPRPVFLLRRERRVQRPARRGAARISPGTA